jgi:hypothetical protein
MKKTATILTALAMGVVSASAGVAPAPVVDKGQPPPPPPIDPCAGPISYNNIELLYANTDWGFFDDDSSDGGIIRAEWSPFANFYLQGGFEYSDVEFGDLWIGNIGIGGYFPLTEHIHLAADGGYVYAEFDFDDFVKVPTPLGGGASDDDDSEDGWYVRPHIRAKWSCFSVHAGAIYRDWSNDSDDSNDPGDDDIDDGNWQFFAQLYYQFAPNWDVTAGYVGGENDFEQWNAGVRFRY